MQAPLGGTPEILRIHPGSLDSRHGRSICALGDVDGDGIGDYAIGAPEETQGFFRQGAARVHSGADGSVLHEYLGPDNYALYGEVVFDAGDLDGDGRADFGYLSSLGARTLRIHAGAGGGLLLELVQPPVPNGSNSFATAFGVDVACVGDLNADGIPDYAVGAPQYDYLTLLDVGLLFTLSGADGSMLDLRIGTRVRGFLGTAVDAAGDLDQDGTPDVLVSAPTEPGIQGAGPGQIFACSGLGLTTLYELIAPVTCSLGVSLDGGGDVTGDGIPDFAAGCAGSAASPLTWIVVFSGADGAVHWVREITRAFRGGFALSFGEDFDGDGIGDLTMFEADYPNPLAVGRLTVFTMGNGDPWIVAIGNPSWGGDVGAHIAVIDDQDADGIPEFLLGRAPGVTPPVSVLAVRDHLRIGATSISAAAGGSVDLQIDFGVAGAGLGYQVLASVEGPEPPSEIGGRSVPLAPGLGLSLTVLANYPAFFIGGIGVLDGAGAATATLDAPPGALPPSLIGRELHFAVLQGDAMAASACSLRRSLRIDP